MKHKSVVIDTTHGIIHFSLLTKQVKSAASETSAKLQAVLIRNNKAVTPKTTITITSFVDHSSEWNTTDSVTPVKKFTEAASLLVSHSISQNSQKDSSQSRKSIGINLFIQGEHTNCRFLRSHSGAIQVHQADGHGNSQIDCGQ